MEFTLDVTSDLRIGMRNYTPTVYDWACVDNFKLIYIKEDETGIGSLTPDSSPMSEGSNDCYDLCGRRINSSLFILHSSLKKGVYIVNGKKLLYNNANN